jgi:hypothetical protein
VIRDGFFSVCARGERVGKAADSEMEMDDGSKGVIILRAAGASV